MIKRTRQVKELLVSKKPFTNLYEIIACSCERGMRSYSLQKIKGR